MNGIEYNEKRILHFFTDEKVVNDAIDFFETAFPNKNLFVVLTKSGTSTIVNDHPNTLILSYHSNRLKKLIRECRYFEEIICHSLWLDLAKIIREIDHPNITWVVWGADLYESLLYWKGYKLYLDEETLTHVRAGRMPICIFKVLSYIRGRIHYRIKMQAVMKIHNLCALPIEYEIINKYIPKINNFNRKSLFYYPIEKMFDESIKDCYVSGKDIWVNNAAGYNGNHVDIFNRLSKFNQLNDVHTPLSYGIKKYAKYVEEEGFEILGNHFKPMLEFIPKKDYYSRFLDSNSFIFGHLRPCAEGNIIVALYFGAKVFLFNSNPILNYYKEMGVKIFSIDDDLTETEALTPLAYKDRLNNREIMINNFSYEKLLSVLNVNFNGF